MRVSLVSRFMRAAARGVWGEITDRIVEGAAFLALIIIVLVRSEWSWGNFLEQFWESLAIAVWTVSAVLVWHAFRAAFSVGKEVRKARQVYRHPAAKLYGSASLVAIVCFVGSLYAWQCFKGRSIPAKLRENPPETQEEMRAHVHVTKFEWTAPSQPGDRASVKVAFENDGQAAIKKLVPLGHLGYFLLKQGPERQLEFERALIANPPEIHGDQFSDNEIPLHADRSFTIQSSPWAQEAIDKFLSGNAVLYAAGVLIYSDDGISTRKAKFCVYTDAKGNMYFCHRGNEEP